MTATSYGSGLALSVQPLSRTSNPLDESAWRPSATTFAVGGAGFQIDDAHLPYILQTIGCVGLSCQPRRARAQ